MITEKEKEAYRLGIEDGLRAFAWWKDGVEFLGNGTHTLKDILEEIENLYSYREEYKKLV